MEKSAGVQKRAVFIGEIWGVKLPSGRKRGVYEMAFLGFVSREEPAFAEAMAGR